MSRAAISGSGAAWGNVNGGSMNNPANANEELHERLTMILRGLWNSGAVTGDELVVLCYASGINVKLIVPDRKAA